MIFPNRTKTSKTYENNRDNIVEEKLRGERIIREAEKDANKFNWNLADEESDSEINDKLNELKGVLNG